MDHIQWRAGTRITLIAGIATAAAVSGIAMSSAQANEASTSNVPTVKIAALTTADVTNAMATSNEAGQRATDVAARTATATNTVGSALSKAAATPVDHSTPLGPIELMLRFLTNLLKSR